MRPERCPKATAGRNATPKTGHVDKFTMLLQKSVIGYVKYDQNMAIKNSGHIENHRKPQNPVKTHYLFCKSWEIISPHPRFPTNSRVTDFSETSFLRIFGGFDLLKATVALRCFIRTSVLDFLSDLKKQRPEKWISSPQSNDGTSLHFTWWEHVCCLLKATFQTKTTCFFPQQEIPTFLRREGQMKSC